MAVSKHDFVAIAGIIASQNITDANESLVDSLVKDLADYFEASNDRFDRQTFYIAALGRNYLRHTKEN